MGTHHTKLKTEEPTTMKNPIFPYTEEHETITDTLGHTTGTIHTIRCNTCTWEHTEHTNTGNALTILDAQLEARQKYAKHHQQKHYQQKHQPQQTHTALAEVTA
nr:MAG TPA: hypothetical protein [Caudoviricetes sp.]